jgi:ADP-ribose pyrophosphatase YjhB (NUDIX family)
VSEHVLVWLLLERDDAVLFALRKGDEAPFAGQLTLPGAEMREEESAVETIGRVAREELGIAVTGEEFVDTLYLKEAGNDYPTNVFRVTAFEGRPRFRESGPYEDVRWGLRAELSDETLPLAPALRSLLTRDGAA